jgi:hypothetical protein
MEGVLSILSLLECFTPALDWAEQCIVVLCLAHFADNIRAGIANIERVTQKKLHLVYHRIGPIEKFHHLLDFLDFISNNRPARILRAVSSAILYHLAQTCRAFVHCVGPNSRGLAPVRSYLDIHCGELSGHPFRLLAT